MDPSDRRVVVLAFLTIPVPAAGGALLAAGATVPGVLVLGAGVVIGGLGGAWHWRTRPR